MITLISRIFIKDDDEQPSSEIRKRYGLVYGYVGIFFNVILFIMKLTAGLVSGSVAIIADAINNLGDAGSNIIMVVGFKMSGRKPDPEHPFGHGRIEYVTGLVVSLMIILMGVELVKSSVDKIIHPMPVESSLLVAVLLLVAILIKLYMFLYNSRAARKLSSATFKAVAMDSLTDCLATFVVLISMAISYFTGLNTDGFFGFAVSAFVLYTGIMSAMDTISPLLGTLPDPEYVKKIEEFVCSYDEIIGIHDLVVHDYGPGRVMISLHAEVPANSDIIKIHDTIDNIERKLNKVLGCHAVIHMDPVVVGDEETDLMNQLVRQAVRQVDESYMVHDFRMVKGPTHTNLIFDVVVPYTSELSEDEIKEAISLRIDEMPGNLFAVIQIDRPYV